MGEFISSIAVLVTLIYLSIQVRQARAESTATAIKDRGSAMRDVMLFQISNDQLGEALLKAGADLGSASFTRPIPALVKAGLSDLEAHKLQQWYTTILHVYMTQHAAMDPGHQKIQDGGLTMNFCFGIGRALWEEDLRRIFSTMSPEFAAHVDGLIAAHDANDAAP